MRIRLRVRLRPDSPAEDREFVLDALRLGRAPSADMVVQDDLNQTVSWQHARVDATTDGPMLSDLKSTNGTFLNGRKIETAERLRVGDTIRFGHAGPMLEVVLLEAQDRPAAPPPLPREERSHDAPPSRRERPDIAPAVARASSAHPAQMSATRALLVGMQKKTRVWMFVAGGCAIVALLTVAIVLWRHEKRLDDVEEEIAKINSRFVDFETDLESVKARQGEIDQSTQSFYGDIDALDKAVASGKANGETIYQRTVRSTAWVIADRGGDGSGSLVAHDGKLLVVTSYHVIHGASKIGVRFPQALDGKVLANQSHYIRDDAPPASQTLSCSVWASDPEVDIAILEVVGMPANLRPLKIAADAPGPGADVHTVGGDPAGSNALWSYTRGNVRQVTGPVDLRTRTGRTVHAKIIETQNPVNRGDSGGPLVNNKCELVGVTFGGVDGANLVTRFIEGGHVKDVLRNRPRKSLPVFQPTPPAPPATPAKATIPKTPTAPPPSAATSHVHALFLIDDSDEVRKDGKRGIGQSVRADGENMRSLFKNGLPPGSYTIETLQNKNANRTNITKYYNSLRGRVSPGDTVFCYYSGHGCTERGTGAHYFSMNGGGWVGPAHNVPRAEVLSQMQSAGGKLTVLITDCCSSWTAGTSRDGPTTSEFSRVQYLVPLLMKNTGVVDWQAASPGETAAGYGNRGGLFTYHLCAASGAGTHAAWNTLFSDVYNRTLRESQGGAKRPIGAGGAAKTQSPYQFPTTSVRKD